MTLFRNDRLFSQCFLTALTFSVTLTSVSTQDTGVISINKCPPSTFTEDIVTIPNQLRPKDYIVPELSFRLIEKFSPKACSQHMDSIILDIPANSSNKPSIIFLDDGMIQINNTYYYRDQYCLTDLNSFTISLTHCKISCAPTGPYLCLQKCCRLSKIFRLSSEGQLKCITPSKGKPKYEPFIYPADKGKRGSNHKNEFKRIQYIKAALDDVLPFIYRELPSSSVANGNRFRFLSNGALTLYEANEACARNPKENTYEENFCIDGLTVEDEPFLGREEDQIVFIPPTEMEVEESAHWAIHVKIWGASIAIFFLVLTLIIYVIMWEKHNIHGWAMFSFVVSMLAFCVTLVILHMVHIFSNENLLGTGLCLTMGISIHFFFLSTVCWMTVINFDFWITFRDPTPTQDRTQNLQRYFCYAMFALGIPTFIVGLSVTLHYSITYNPFHRGSLPGYGKLNSCNLHPCSAKYYLYMPMTILLAFNILFFSWTVFTLWTYKRKTQNAGGTGGHKQSWILFCKLFLVMGITWVLEALGGFLSMDFVLFDIICLFQAIPIFCIFAAKRENLLWISKKYPCTKKFIRPILGMNCFSKTGEMDFESNSAANRTAVTFNARFSSETDKSGSGRSKISLHEIDEKF